MPLVLSRMQPSQAGLLGHLWQYYQLESSTREELDVDASGRFETPDQVFEVALRSEGRNSAHLVQFDGQVAGFLLLESAQIEGKDITEFADIYVLPRYRARGVASQVIEQVILRSSQPWLIAVFRDDVDALSFWRSAFERLPFTSVREVEPPELPEFHEFVINEGGALYLPSDRS
jgi:predicted acetyltransferase